MLISTGGPVTECCRELELAENYLCDLERGDFIERMAFYIAEINALHPFREGNGRTQRIFANQLARQAGWELNFKAVSPERLCEAYISSMVDMSDLIDLLNDTVSPKEN